MLRKMIAQMLKHVAGIAGVQSVVAKRLLLVPIVFMVVAPNAGAMTEMGDEQLAVVTGQALMMMDKQAGAIGSDVTFYKAGLDAMLEINTNIEKLQLGCGGINGPGCDIDIDRLSLSGPESCPGGRPNCSSILTRPFFEFAIKNDQSKTMREIVGFRLSAEQASGLLTIGDQTPAMTDQESMNGINTLSGYMLIGPATGTATTEVRPMSYSDQTFNGKFYPGLNRMITGNLWLTVVGIINDVVAIETTQYNMTVSSASANVVTTPTVVSGSRLTSAELLGSATINPVAFSGPMTAQAINLLGLGIDLDLQKNVTGAMQGLTATVPIQQSLSFIHKIPVNNPFSLSMQRQSVLWPGAAAEAETGWWMAFEDEIDIGNISPEAQVELTNAVLLQALGAPGVGAGCSPSVNCALATGLGVRNGQPYGIRCNGLNECLGGSLDVGTLNVPLNVLFPLEDLKLGAQSVTPNCFGTARFC